MKHILFVCFLVISVDVYSQTNTHVDNDYAQHDKITRLLIRSYKVILPDTTYQILKNYALINKLSEYAPIRQISAFQVILNTELTKEERLFACDYYIESYNMVNPPNGPILYIKEIKASILKN